VRPPFEVYVNGVVQTEGVDYEHRSGVLLFDRPLVKEGRVAWWRWLIGAFGVGTYRRDDQVDVRYELRGRPLVAHALDIEPPGDRTDAVGRMSDSRSFRKPADRR
jgi:hypothetical protein